MEKNNNLSQLHEGEHAVVQKILTTGAMRRRLLDLGLIEGTKVQCLQKSPAGDPIAFLVRGAQIALRSEDSETIIVAV